MAVRLSVIMVHSTPPTASGQQLAEGVVGELIGLPGIDLTLVEPFGQLCETSTDRLTLASLSGDVAVLDWHRPADILASLESIQFDGQRTPHQHDRDAPAPPANSRRIYAYDLSKFSQAKEVIASLSRLNEDRQVRAFSLGPLPTSLATTSRPTLGKNAPAREHLQGANGNSVEPDKRHSLVDSQTFPEGVQPPSRGDQRLPESEKSLDLDDLLDELDRSDT